MTILFPIWPTDDSTDLISAAFVQVRPCSLAMPCSAAHKATSEVSLLPVTRMLICKISYSAVGGRNAAMIKGSLGSRELYSRHSTLRAQWKPPCRCVLDDQPASMTAGICRGAAGNRPE